MTRDAERRTLVRWSPVEEANMPAHPGHCISQRDVAIQVENVWRIDERRDEDRRRAVAAAIAKRRPAQSSYDGPIRLDVVAVGSLIGDQPGQRCFRHRRIAICGQTHQCQKQRQRTRRAFMLQRTMLR